MLLGLLSEHRGAFEYDWRSRFHLSVRVIGHGMSWGEAFRMVEILASDTSSRLGAALAGWQYPATRENLVLRDLYDLQHRSKAKRKPAPYPRPWDAPPRKIGGASLTVAEYKRIRAAQLPAAKKRTRDSRGRFVKSI